MSAGQMNTETGTNNGTAGAAGADGTTGGAAGTTAATGTAGADGAAGAAGTGGDSGNTGGEGNTGNTGNTDGTGGDPVIPETYEFQAPEGLEIDQGLADKVTPAFKDLKLTQEQASKLNKVYADHIAESREAHAKQVESWGEQCRKDPEIGGESFAQNVQAAQNLLAKEGTPELSKILSESGLGSHPEFVRLMVKLGKQHDEAPHRTGGASNGEALTLAERMYGKQNQQ